MRLTKLSAILLAVATCISCYIPSLATEVQRSEIKTIKAGLLARKTRDRNSIPPTLISIDTTQASKKNKTLALPAGMEGNFPDSNGAVYKILSARLEPLDNKSRALKFKVRCTTGNSGFGGLSKDLFRLVIDGVPQAPSNATGGYVEARSAQEGEVIFTVPIATRTAILKIGEKETADIPWDFSAVKPQPERQSEPLASASVPSSTPQTLILPAGMEGKFPDSNGEAVYKILSARLEPLSSNSRALKFKVRCTTGNSGFGGLSKDLFRLVIDGVPQAPSDATGGYVEARSAQEGEVVFSVPISTRTAILKIGEKQTTDIPWDFTPPKQ